jgi:hypothetical protein
VARRIALQRVPNNRAWNRATEQSWAESKRVLLNFPSNPKKIGINTLGYCSHFGIINNGLGTIGSNLMSIYPNNNIIYWYPDYKIFGLNGGETNEEADEALNAWLQDNELWISYVMANPIITYHDEPPLRTYPRYTHVEQITDGVRAHMQLTAKVVDGRAVD